MKLSRLLAPLGITEGYQEVEITDIVYDSRKAKQGCAFVCMRGSNSDGHKYAAGAAQAGAAVIVAEEPVEVGLLVNASGFGKFRAVVDTPLETNLNMVDLNCQAVVALCQLTAPYMPRGGQIINIASVAAFQPIPYINVYGASKAFVLSFSRALNRELRSRGVGVMALCPFWTRTAFFDRATGDGGQENVVKKYVAMYEPEDMVRRAWRDAKRGKDVSQFGFVARFQAGLTKLLPHSLVMDVWMRQQKLQ